MVEPKPNWFDWFIYRLFRWRWNPLFRQNHRLRVHFVFLWNDSQVIGQEESLLSSVCRHEDWEHDDYEWQETCRQCGAVRGTTT